MASTALEAIPPDVVTKTGPRLLGFLFHWGLFGVLIVQVYLYYLAFPHDSKRIKTLVYIIFLFEVLQTGFVTASAYTVFGSGYGNFSEFDNVQLAWFSVPVISGIVAFLAQAFYAFRISVLSGTYWVAGVINFLALVQLGGSIAWGVVFKQSELFSRLQVGQYPIFIGIWNGGSALCDVIIAVFMTYYLSRARRNTCSIKSTDALLKRAIKLVIETGTVTAAVAVLNLVLISLPSHTSYYLVPSQSLAKIYSNSMMVVLNSRIRLGVEGPQSAFPDGLDRARGRIGVEDGQVECIDLSRNMEPYTPTEGVLVTREQVVFQSRGEASVVDLERKGSHEQENVFHVY